MVQSKKVGVIAIVLVAVLALSSCWSADQGADIDQLNRDRAANGAAALAGDVQLMGKSQAWSDHMAATGVLEHSGGGTSMNTGGVTGWCALAENVGNGSSVAAVRQAFMNSANHRANTLGRWNLVGTGVTVRNGTYWVTETFQLSC
jgi:uncharacterized protein YkwD